MKRPAPPILESDLPETARNLVRLLGWAKAEALMRELGGQKFPVPKAADNNRAGSIRHAQLVDAVGERAADRLIAEYGGDILNIPNCKIAMSRARMRAMRARFDGGATIEDLVREFGVTARWVSSVLKMPDEGQGAVLEQGGQMGLF